MDRRAALPVALVLTSALLVPIGRAGAAGPVSGAHSPAAQAMTVLAHAANTTPSREFATIGDRNTLRSDVARATKLINAASWCAAAATLLSIEQFLRGAPGTPPPLPPTPTNALVAQAYNVHARILGGGAAPACGGAAGAAGPATTPLTSMSSSDNQQLTFHVAFPSPQFAPQQGDGTPYLQLDEDGTGNGGDLGVGAPEVPFASETIAVPIGATPTVQVLGTTGYQLPAVQLWPHQPLGMADAAVPLPPGLPAFTIDPAAYASDTPFPAHQTQLGAVTSERDLRLVTLTIAAGSYVPSSQTLTVLTGADIQVSFAPSTPGAPPGSFGTTDLTSAWNTPFEAIYQSTVLNWPTVSHYLTDNTFLTTLCGEEMMVITDGAAENPEIASDYAADRTAHGVFSRVFLTTGPGGIGTTPTAIRNAILQQYNSHCETRPSYVVILGDTTVVPTFEFSLPGNPLGEDPVGTDRPYGYLHQAAAIDSGDYSDQRPDVLVGRIPGDDTETGPLFEETETLLGYADTPPLSPHFYGHVTGAEFFQACSEIQSDCKYNGSFQTPSTQDLTSFMRSSETVASEAKAAGKAFVRVANDEQTNDPDVTIKPQTFDDGSPLPGGIHWNGGASDIASSLNAGSFLVWHSDHGATNSEGWYEPQFYRSDVRTLLTTEKTKELLPFVWSSDCDSGKFDQPNFTGVTATTGSGDGGSWMENFEAVGFVGASRISAIWWDGILLEAMGANLFPEKGNVFRVLLNLPPQQPVLEMGALLAATQSNVIGQADMINDIGAQGAVLEYNLLGDPSMAIHRVQPPLFKGALVTNTLINANDVSIHSRQRVPDGALVTLEQNGQYIGRGIMQGGTADVPTAVSLDNLNDVQAILGGDAFVATTVPLTP